LPGGSRRRCVSRNDKINLQANEIGSQLGQAFNLLFSGSVLDDDVLPFYVAALAQALSEWAKQALQIGGLDAHK
jgi:hypothetical protein